MVYGWWTRLAGFAPAGLVVGCLALPPAADDPQTSLAEVAPSGPGSAAPAPIDWSQGDCLSLLHRLRQAADDGRLGPDDRPPFALELVAAPGSWLDAAPDLPIEADLPLAADDGAPADAARCVIRIGPARDLRAAHRAFDVQDVRSAYQSGLRRETNPDYQAARRALREAKDGAGRTPKVVDVDEPMLDLIGTTVGGLIGALDRRSQRQEVDDAAAALAATPRSIDQPVYRPYGFERVVMRGQKQAVVPVAVLDGRGRLLRQTELRQSERREFFVLRGLDPRDRDYEQHRTSSMTRAELARWARTPPALRLSSVAAALTGDDPAAEALSLQADIAWPEEPASTVAGPPVEVAFADRDRPSDPWQENEGLDIAGLTPGRAPDRSAGSGPRAGVVGIRAGRSAGSGFYVRANLVLTTSQLVGTTSVVDVTTADGATVPALVAAVDPARNLALLHVPRPGPALALYQGGARPAAPPAGTASDPGRPVLLDGQVVGMSAGAADAYGATVPIDAIRAFLDGQAGVLAAIP